MLLLHEKIKYMKSKHKFLKPISNQGKFIHSHRFIQAGANFNSFGLLIPESPLDILIANSVGPAVLSIIDFSLFSDFPPAFNML